MTIFTITWATEIGKLLPPIMRNTSMQSNAVGDFIVGSPLNDYIYRIVMSSPGHWKNNPSVGVNIWLFLNAPSNPDQIVAVIKKQLIADVFTSPQVDASEFPIIVVNDLKFIPNNTNG